MPITHFLMIAAGLWFLASIILSIAVYRKKKLTSDIFKIIGFTILAFSVGCIILAFGIGTRPTAYAEVNNQFSLNNYQTRLMDKNDNVTLVNHNLNSIDIKTQEGFQYTVTLPKKLPNIIVR